MTEQTTTEEFQLERDRLDLCTMSDVVDELYRARCHFGSFSNAHEGFAVLLEEVHELWDQVRSKKSTPDNRRALMRAEALQVAAMAVRFVREVCDAEDGQ